MPHPYPDRLVLPPEPRPPEVVEDRVEVVLRRPEAERDRVAEPGDDGDAQECAGGSARALRSACPPSRRRTPTSLHPRVSSTSAPHTSARPASSPHLVTQPKSDSAHRTTTSRSHAATYAPGERRRCRSAATARTGARLRPPGASPRRRARGRRSPPARREVLVVRGARPATAPRPADRGERALDHTAVDGHPGAVGRAPRYGTLARCEVVPPDVTYGFSIGLRSIARP